MHSLTKRWAVQALVLAVVMSMSLIGPAVQSAGAANETY